MIPTLRSMIVAMLLAMVALGGGFGLFAAFRINHAPARLASAALPLRLVADDPMLPAGIDGTGQSFGSRFKVSEALLASATAALSLGNTERPDAAGSPGAGIDPAADNGVAAPSAAVTPPTESTAPETPSDRPQASQASTEVAPAETLATGTPNNPPPVQGAAEAKPPETVAAKTPDDPPSAHNATQTAPAETAATGAPDAHVPPAETATAAIPAETAALATAASNAQAEQQDAARKVAARKRLATVRRVRRARATAIAQSANPNNAFPQPSSQAAPQAVGGPFVSPPTAKHRQN